MVSVKILCSGFINDLMVPSKEKENITKETFILLFEFTRVVENMKEMASYGADNIKIFSP